MSSTYKCLVEWPLDTTLHFQHYRLDGVVILSAQIVVLLIC